MNKALVRVFGSDPPAPASTILLELEDAKVTTNLMSGHFNRVSTQTHICHKLFSKGKKVTNL